MTTHRARTIIGLIALAATLAACTGSSGKHGQPSGSAGSGPTSNSGPVQSGGGSSGASGSAGTSGSAGGPGSAPPTHAAPAKPLRTATVQGAHATYTIKVWADVKTSTCADHAHGAQVVNFLRAHACTGLQRLIATTAVNGKAVGFAQSRLGFRGSSPAAMNTAGDFLTVIEKAGAGNLDDLLRAGYRLPSGPARVPSPDAVNAQSQDAGVTITDAWYLKGATPANDPDLTTMAEDIFGQF